jgi:hypothetical protein
MNVDPQRQAEALQESARAHKRAEFHHRKQARALMRQLEDLRADCEKRGITLVIERHSQEAQS